MIAATLNALFLAAINRPRFLALVFALLLASLAMPISNSVALDRTTAGLADATVLIIRHAEKPDSGTGLAPAGEARAHACVVF